MKNCGPRPCELPRLWWWDKLRSRSRQARCRWCNQQYRLGYRVENFKLIQTWRTYPDLYDRHAATLARMVSHW